MEPCNPSNTVPFSNSMLRSLFECNACIVLKVLVLVMVMVLAQIAAEF
jgi:hypothetical protein